MRILGLVTAAWLAKMDKHVAVWGLAFMPHTDDPCDVLALRGFLFGKLMNGLGSRSWSHHATWVGSK